jgi:hypothetical protein
MASEAQFGLFLLQQALGEPTYFFCALRNLKEFGLRQLRVQGACNQQVRRVALVA